MRWIITGGSGFLGTNLLHTMRDLDGEVFVLSRTLPKWPVVHPWIHYIEQDVRETEAYRSLIEPGCVVVHMVSGTYPGKAERVIESDIQDHLLSTVRLAQMCAERQVRSLIFLSSGGAIYGEQAASPISESSVPKPISAYGVMKSSIEQYLRIIHEQQGLSCTMLRVSNPFGRWHRGSGQGAINVFLQHALEGRPISIWGSGDVVRDFIPAVDVANAIRHIALHQASGYNTYNIGTGHGLSLNEVLERIWKVTDRRCDIVRLPARMVDVRSNVLDCSKIKREHGLSSTTPFMSALEDTWRWVQQNNRHNLPS